MYSRISVEVIWDGSYIHARGYSTSLPSRLEVPLVPLVPPAPARRAHLHCHMTLSPENVPKVGTSTSCTSCTSCSASSSPGFSRRVMMRQNSTCSVRPAPRTRSAPQSQPWTIRTALYFLFNLSQLNWTLGLDVFTVCPVCCV